MKQQSKGNLYILLTALLWSTGGIFIKFIPGNPMAINGARSLVALIFFGFYRRQWKIKLNKYVVLAGICLALTNCLYVVANKLTTAGTAIVLQYLAPIFVLIWDSIYQKKKPEKQQILFVVMAFIGMVLFFFDQLDVSKLLGNITAILAGVAFSGVFFVNSLPGASSEDASMLGFAIAFILGIPFLSNLQYDNMASNLAILFLGVFQVGLAYVIFAKGSKLTTPVNASLISLIEAVLNPTWVYLFYHETLGRFSLIGAAIIMVAVILNVLSTSKKVAK